MARKSVTKVTEKEAHGWSYLTNHALVLVCVADDPYIRLVDIASQVGITTRAVQKILGDLEMEGAIDRTKDGRNNTYAVNPDCSLRHALEGSGTVGELLAAMRQG
jgi:DNA-binding MarR family transcriptional regulator